MHPLGGGGYQPLTAGYSGMEGQQSPPDQAGSPQDNGTGAAGAADGQNGAGAAAGGQPQYSDINQILDQILNITDQSLDEAQV